MNTKSTISEQELVSAFKQGQEWATEEVYTRYFQRVVELCTHYTRSREDGEDIAQDVMCKIILQKKLVSFRGESRLWAWIKRVAINECNEMFRQRKRTREIALGENGESQNLEELIPAKGLNPEEAACQTEEIQMAEVLMSKLATQYQQAIRLSIYMGESYKEAALRMQVPVRAFGLYRHRALLYLTRLMQDRFQNPEVPSQHAMVSSLESCCKAA